MTKYTICSILVGLIALNPAVPAHAFHGGGHGGGGGFMAEAVVVPRRRRWVRRLWRRRGRRLPRRICGPAFNRTPSFSTPRAAPQYEQAFGNANLQLEGNANRSIL